MRVKRRRGAFAGGLKCGGRARGAAVLPEYKSKDR